MQKYICEIEVCLQIFNVIKKIALFNEYEEFKF